MSTKQDFVADGSFEHIAAVAWVKYLAGTSRTTEEATQEFHEELDEIRRAAAEKAWDEGHNHCFHVEDPAQGRVNPYRKEQL